MPRYKDPTKLTPKQATIVKAKVEATLKDIPQRQWARQIYPKATQHAAEVEVSKNLNKPDVKIALDIALAKHNLTADRITKVVDEAMSATKTVVVGSKEEAFADEVPDHGIRLKAAGMAANFMGLNNKTDTISPNFIQINNTIGNRYND